MKADRHLLRGSVLPLLLLLCTGLAAARADQIVHLTVSVSDEQGNPVSGARVNVYQQEPNRSRFLDVPTPPDYQEDTNAQGLARIQIRVLTSQDLDVTVEVSRESMKAESRRISLGKNFPTRLPPEKFILRKRSASGEGQTVINVIIEVKDMEGNPLDGAQVLIRDSSLGQKTGQFPGTSGPDGRATIPVWYAATAPQETLGVQASKNGYKTGKTTIELTEKQVGKTIVGGEIKLEKAAAVAGTKVTVTVKEKDNPGAPVREADVVLDGGGYYSDSTNSAGEVTFYVSEPGDYEVRIKQDNYRPFAAKMRVPKNGKEIPLSYELEPKGKKDEGQDKIEVTVLWKDSTEKKSKPRPLPGAFVKAGTIGGHTESDGKVTLQGAFEDKQDVSVEATGYKSQRRTITVRRPYYGAGRGSTAFTLDPELSENSPIRIIVEVQDAASAPIKDADVDFYSASGVLLGGGSTKKDGRVDFRNSDSPNTPVAELRKGITVNIKKSPQYKAVINRSVPSNLLNPSLEAGHFTVQLERDWSELEKDLTAFETKVAAWTADRYAKPSKDAESALIDKALSARKRAEQLRDEIQAANETFHVAIAPGMAAEWCRKATKLKEDIQLCEAEANEKAQKVRQTLDSATTLSSICSTAADAETIRGDYRNAIKLVGEIGVREKKAVKDRNELMTMAKEAAEMKKTLADLENKVAAIREQLQIAEETEKSATEQYGRAANAIKTLASRHVALNAEFAVLTVKYEKERAEMPAELRRRFDKLVRALETRDTYDPYGQAKNIPESITTARVAIENLRTEAERTLALYHRVSCDIDTMDEMVTGIGTTLTNASFEIGLAADLPARADGCAAKAAATGSPSSSPSPSPSALASAPPGADEISVPDVSGYDDPGAMKAAAGPNMAGVILATKATPPPGSTKLFAYQDPLPNTKVKRGPPLPILKIYIYQSLVSAATPSPGTSPSPSASAAEEMLTVPSVKGAGSIEYARIILNQAGFKSAFRAIKPNRKEDELTIADATSPAAGEKARRGSTVVVFVYQKFEDGSPSPTASPVAPAKPGSVPNLVGMTLESAQTSLSAAGLSVGGIDDSAKTENKDQVNKIFEQSPAAGAAIPSNKAVTVRRYGGLSTKGSTPAPPSVVEQLIPGAEKDLIGEFSGTVDTYQYDSTDGRHRLVPEQMRITIKRDESGKWKFYMLIGQNAQLGSGIGGDVTVSGGELHWEWTYSHHGSPMKQEATVRVNGAQLVGTRKITHKDFPAAISTANFRGTRTK